MELELEAVAAVFLPRERDVAELGIGNWVLGHPERPVGHVRVEVLTIAACRFDEQRLRTTIRVVGLRGRPLAACDEAKNLIDILIKNREDR